jgi:mono/diheme cytochrome c family protein
VDEKDKTVKTGRRVPLHVQVVLIWLAVYLFLKFAIKPPLPFSLIFMYMTMVLIGLLVYVSIFEDVLREFFVPIKEFFVGDRLRSGAAKAARVVVLILIPLYVGYLTYQKVSPRFEPPLSQRVIHPAPPVEVTGYSNPLRRDPDKYKEYVKEGARIYFQNCVFCHGDRFLGKGIFAHGFNPPPADFADPTTIAMLQESYVFWRISTGGPGLPDESTPWDSAMPRWQDMLGEQDRWKVAMFLYDATGYTPRTWE